MCEQMTLKLLLLNCYLVKLLSIDCASIIHRIYFSVNNKAYTYVDKLCVFLNKNRPMHARSVSSNFFSHYFPLANALFLCDSLHAKQPEPTTHEKILVWCIADTRPQLQKCFLFFLYYFFWEKMFHNKKILFFQNFF